MSSLVLTAQDTIPVRDTHLLNFFITNYLRYILFGSLILLAYFTLMLKILEAYEPGIWILIV